MLKKIIKITAYFIGFVFLLLLIIPFAFKGKIIKIAKEQINNSVNATVGFQDLSISLIRNFPDVSVDLQDLSVINKAPFKGDTLAAIGHVYLNINIKSLLGDKVPQINSVQISDVFANVKVNKDSVANYDIMLPAEVKTPEVSEEVSAPFMLTLQEYSLENLHLKYADEVGGMQAEVINFNHKGSGDLSQDQVNLNTNTTADAITFMMGEVAYLKEVKLNYDAIIGVDFSKDLKLIFKQNKAQINDLNLAFDGAFIMLKDAYDLDFVFASEKSAFKSLLSLIPNAYTADFPKVKTTGALDFSGKIKGQYSENSIPTLDIVVQTKNASLKYPDLPNPIENINIDTRITNTSGLIDDTKVEVKNFGFKVLQDVFQANATVTKPISNLTVQSKFKGVVNLGNLKKAYPVPPLDFELKGVIKANLATAFNMQMIDKGAYDKIDSQGLLEVQGVSVGSAYTPKPMLIQKAVIAFNLKDVSLKEAAVVTGGSDIQLKGALNNVYGYVFSDDVLKGNIAVSSSIFNVGDFYESDTTAVAVTNIDSIPSEQIKIPANIEFTGAVRAEKVIYDDIVLSNFKADMSVKDQRIVFSNAKANMFQGTLGMDGFVDTKPDATTYDFDMKLKQVDITSAYNSMGMLQKIAPIMNAFNGKFDTDLDVKGVLGNDFMPDLSKLSGGAFTNLQVDKVDASKNKFLSLAENKMSFIDLDKTDLKDLATQVTFKDSKVNVKPFKLQYKDIPMTIGGTHSFDNDIAYDLNLDLPAKYLGASAQNLVSKLSGADQETTRVPLNVKVGGTITKPTVVPGMKDAIASLGRKVVDNQKEKAKKEVKKKVEKEVSKKVNELLGIKKDTTNTDQKSTKEEVKETGRKLIKGLLGR